MVIWIGMLAFCKHSMQYASSVIRERLFQAVPSLLDSIPARRELFVIQ
jgi:hypothetical protein